jgi:hypothetical protein
MRQRIIKLLTTMAFVPALFIGTAPLALADGASTTGPNSGVTVNSSSSTTINNSNNVTVTNTSSQTATSGNATVSNNTTGGNATSGNASNSNTTSTSVSISNISSLPSGGGSSASTTGPNSPIVLDFHSSTHVTNNNYVSVTNDNYQRASTGNAKVSNNTTGGNATSGNASNSNCVSTSISISNGGAMASPAANACAKQSGGEGGGSNGGSAGNPNQGGAGGQVLGASFTVASIAGGRGAAFSTLPNTGLRDGINAWLVATILTLAASVLYWNKVIAPRLKNV